jgi:hypothetical protein
MRGGAQAHLMLCSDGHYYVVKFRNNPQHLRVLANERLAARLAEIVGLPVPTTEPVEVNEWLVQNAPEMHIQLAQSVVRCEPGLQFGSRYVLNPTQGQVFDYMPVEMLDRVTNLASFAGILAFDKWTGNVDGRQAAFWRYARQRKYTASFIDHGYCFNAGEWTFPDHPLKGVYARTEVYGTVTGWDSFEPWLSRIERMPAGAIWRAAEAVPAEWYGDDRNAFEQLVATLIERRNKVRHLIEAFQQSPRRPFARWSCAA